MRLLRQGNSSPSVSGCTFQGNDGADGGGGIYADFASPTFDGCLFLGNAGQYGGGAYVYESSSTFTDCIFSANYSSGPFSGGGGLYCDYGSDTEVTNCTFSDNGADEYAGGVQCLQANPVLTNCIIAFSTSGPAVVCEDGVENPTLICCDLYGNAGGNWTGCIADQATTGGNVSAEPLFCNRPGGDFTIDASSVCAAAHSGGCGLIGALDVGCDTPVQARSWGSIKATYR